MIGACPLGGVGGLLSGMTGEVDSEIPPSSDLATLLKSLIGIGQCGRGVTILGGCCSSGMP